VAHREAEVRDLDVVAGNAGNAGPAVLKSLFEAFCREDAFREAAQAQAETEAK
jgi:hypothetical protein